MLDRAVNTPSGPALLFANAAASETEPPPPPRFLPVAARPVPMALPAVCAVSVVCVWEDGEEEGSQGDEEEEEEGAIRAGKINETGQRRRARLPGPLQARVESGGASARLLMQLDIVDLG